MELKELLGSAYKEGMTVEEIELALADIVLPSSDEETQKLRNALTKANSEAAKLKKELRSKTSDQEMKELESQSQLEELKEKYDALLKETTLAKNKANLIALGYEEKLAEDTAKAMLDGDTSKLFANQKKFKDAIEKQVKDDLMKGTPEPTGGNGNTKLTKDDILNMKDPLARQEAIANNIDLFNEE